MNIYLSEQLKKLRKKKENTQEDLANHLGITVQAVSKWERNEGYPDITLLPSIASYYNVSIDDLLGVGEIEKERKLKEYEKQNDELFNKGKTAERLALLRQAKKEYPNELRVIYQLMYALQAEDRKENADEIIKYGEQILNESTDNIFREGAIQSLAFTYYYGKKDAETAKKYANMSSTYAVTKNEMLPRFLEGDKAIEYCQRNIQELIDMVGLNTNIMLWKGKYSPEEKIKAYEFVINCYNLLYPDNNCGFYHERLSEIFEYMGGSYLKLNNVEKMFDCLEKSTDNAIKVDTQKDGEYTAFMVNKLSFSSREVYKNYEENTSGLLLKKLKSPKYAQFQDHPQMQKIIEKLTPVAVL